MTPARGWPYLAGFVAFFTVPFAVHLVRVWRGDVTLPAGRPAGAGARLFGPLFVSYCYWLLRPLFRAAERIGVTPNQVTLSSLVVAVAGALAIATGHFALASALVVGGGALDMVDGHLARTKNMATSAGAFLDSTVDRICDGLLFGGCVVHYAGTPVMAVALAVLVLSFTVSYARSRGEVLGVTGSEGLMQRADRLVLLAAALASSSDVVTAGGLCLLAVLNAVTAFRRIAWTVQQLRPKTPAERPVAAPAAFRIGA
ncbi:MAG TPA: CDP-alcohol phosphatidyltransferase family protein [Polyangia bacterium]|nr:CDP-alcohol phosphatidyltransferase family protein [Polyangia bacterium]